MGENQQTFSGQVDTRDRLIEAAGRVFAEQGFQRATVREICRQANANIAAVNYHFHDKESLYAEALRRAHCATDGEERLALELEGDAEQRLHGFVRAFLLRMFDPQRPAWHGLLIARELFEPTAAFDAFVEETIRPRHKLLLSILRELLGPAAPEEYVRRSAHSVIGQLLFYHHGQHLLSWLEPEHGPEPVDVERLAAHIARFSIGAVKWLAQDAVEGSTA